MAKLNTQSKVRLSVIAIIIFALIFGAIDAPKYVDNSIDWFNQKVGTNFPHVWPLPFHLGLDLQGGTHLVYEADVSEVPEDEQGSSVEGVRDVIERRVNAFGVAEPVVQTNKAGDNWRVIVELAGITNVEDAIAMIGETPLLEFKEQNLVQVVELTEEEQTRLDEYNDDAKQRAQDILDRLKDGDDYAEIAAELSEDPITKDRGGDLGYLNSSNTTFHDMYNGLLGLDPDADELVTSIITTEQGYNIINLSEIRDFVDQVRAKHLLICFEGSASCENDTSKEDARALIESLKEQANPDNFEELVKANSTEPGADGNGGELGFFSRGSMVPPFEEVVFAQETGTISEIVETQFGFHIIHKTEEKITPEFGVFRILVKTLSATDIRPPMDEWKNTDLSGKQLQRSFVQFDQNTSEPTVSLEFDNEGKELFADITERNIGKPVAIFLDGQPISVPRVNQIITEGQAVITGNFTIEEARALTRNLNAGALPVPIELVSQQTIGASLGASSLQKSMVAGMVGLLFVVLFMILYYRIPGVLAVLALIVYTSFLLFLFKLIPITLTLAGIAGFILSLGLAVDANVLIFERLKEELRTGKPLGSAVQEGFKRAWPSIRDGNASTLITCFILMWFGTSAIKGFAITLGVGILLSMFSAIVVTRSFLLLAAQTKLKNKKSLWIAGGGKISTEN